MNFIDCKSYPIGEVFESLAENRLTNRNAKFEAIFGNGTKKARSFDPTSAIRKFTVF
jgi:hypothetical protein